MEVRADEALGERAVDAGAVAVPPACDDPAELVEVAAGSPIPGDLDVYLFGGGEDDPQLMAADGMRASRAAVARAVTRTFPRTGGGTPRSARRPRAHRGGRVRLRDRDALQTQFVRVAPAPHEPRRHLALVLALEVLGSDPDARLYQELRERLGLGYEVSAEVEVGMGWAASVVSATTGPHDGRRLEAAVERILDAGAAGFEVEEIERARRKLRHRHARLADSRLDRAITHAVRVVAGRPTVADTIDLLGRIEQAEVEAAWREHLRAPTVTCVLSP